MAPCFLDRLVPQFWPASDSMESPPIFLGRRSHRLFWGTSGSRTAIGFVLPEGPRGRAQNGFVFWPLFSQLVHSKLRSGLFGDIFEARTRNLFHLTCLFYTT